MVHPPETVFRYAYTSKAGDRCIARVTIYKRVATEDSDTVLLMLRCVGGAWPDRPGLTEAKVGGVPVCKGVMLTVDEEVEWCAVNLLAES